MNEFIKNTGWEKQAGMIQASALEPGSIFNDPETRPLIDFSKLVAIMMIVLIHLFNHRNTRPFWNDGGRRWKSGALLMMHAITDDCYSHSVAGVEEVYAKTAIPVFLRRKEEIEPIMDGCPTRPHLWNMEEMEEDETEPKRTAMW